MRLFIAIEIPDSIREYLSTLAVPGKKAEKHITLKFLGEVPDSRLEELITTLQTIRFQTFSLKLSGMGFFPDKRRPRVVWAGVEPSALVLQKQIEELLLPLGFQRDNRFHPHITLSRLRSPAPVNTLPIEPREWEVDSFKLIKSTLTPQGPIYEALFTQRCE
jgi:RNA 2',3'-cyclic 3'-phosphodiesterase